MKLQTPQEEAKMLKAIEKTISLTNEGMSPNEALEKVARENSYSPNYIKLMASAYNKSKSVAFLKTASAEERASSFPLAEAEVIIKNIYTNVDGMEKKAFHLPSKDFSKISIEKLSQAFEKTASAETTFESYIHKYNMNNPQTYTTKLLEKYAAVKTQVETKLEADLRVSYVQMNNAIDDVVAQTSRMTEKEFNKVARNIVNGYPSSGIKLLNLIAMRSNKPQVDMQKTANAVVFPSEEPYLTLSKVYDYANQVIVARKAREEFTKMAEDDYLTNTLATFSGTNALPDLIGGAEALKKGVTGGKDKKSDVSDLDPKFFNALKEVEAKKHFMDLVLYDTDLNKYDLPALMKAYNTSVSMVPDSFSNKALLRNLMLRNLETGGIKDPFELKNELDMSKLTNQTRGFKMSNKVLENSLISPPEKEKREKDKHGPTLLRNKEKSKSILSILATPKTVQEKPDIAQEAMDKATSEEITKTVKSLKAEDIARGLTPQAISQMIQDRNSGKEPDKNIVDLLEASKSPSAKGKT